MNKPVMVISRQNYLSGWAKAIETHTFMFAEYNKTDQTSNACMQIKGGSRLSNLT